MSKASPLASSVTHFAFLAILAAVIIGPVALRFSKVPGKLVIPVHKIPVKEPGPKSLPARVAATDTDGDGIPDDWENSHFLNPNDPTDASSDFDVDGVTALEEYLNATNSLGKWKKQTFAPPANLASATISPVAVNDVGQLLVTATNIAGSSAFKTYFIHQTPDNTWTWTEIIPPGFVAPGDIKGQDLNDRGDMLLRWNDASGIHGTLRTADGQFQALTDGAGHAATGFRLNNSSEWVGLRNSDSAAVSFINGVSRVVDNMGAAYSYCGINDYGEAVGTYSDGMGSDRVFLEGGGTLFSTGFPGDYPFFDPVQNTWNIPSSLNDDGVFGGSVTQMSSTRIYLYDGRYESFIVSGTWPADSAARVDDFGRLLTYSGTLYRDGVAIPLSSLNPGGTYPLTAAVISRSGAILTKQPGSSTLIVLTSDQDQDGDGMSDDWEDIYGLRKDFAGDATLDKDGDGVNNLGEYLLARNPNINEDVPAGSPTPDLRPGVDSDGDGMPNVWEWEHGLNYQDASDAESHPLTYKTDPDRDGYSNLQEYKLGTDPKGAPAFRVKELGAIPFAASLDFSKITLGSDGTSDQLVFAATRPEGTFPLRWQARQGAASGTSDWYAGTVSQSSILAASTSGAVAMNVGGSLTYWESQNKAPRTILGVSTDTSTLSLCKMSPSGNYLVGNRVRASNQTTTAFIWHMGDSSSYGVPISLPLPAGINQIDVGSMVVNDAACVAADVYTTGGVRKSVLWKLSSDGFTVSAVVLNSLSGGTTTGVAGLSNSTNPVIAGYSATASGNRAVVWSSAGAVSDLGIDPAMNSSISAVSPSGVLAGVWNNPSLSATSQCFIARPGSAGQWRIETQGSVQSYVSISSVNNFGEAQGLSRPPNAGSVAFPTIWRAGSAFLISNTLPPSYTLTSTISFNANGSLLAQATKGGSQIYALISQDIDTDADGMPDAYENEHGFNAFSIQDAGLDSDGDGLSNAEEFRRSTDPRKKDTDGDGMDDKWELDWGLDPLNGEDAYLDPDGDGVTNAREYVINTRPTGLFKAEILSLSGDESFASIDDEGSVITSRLALIKDRNYNEIVDTSGLAPIWRGRLTPQSPRIERQLPFGTWEVQTNQGLDYHFSWVRSLGGGKMEGVHLGYGGLEFQPLANSVNLFTFDAKTTALVVKDWGTVSAGFVPPTGWEAVPAAMATSPSGNFISVQGSSTGQLLDPLGVPINSMPFQNPLPGYTSVTWKALNNNGDAVGLLTPGNRAAWRKAGSSTPVILIAEPVEWGNDDWGLGYSAITDDDLVVLNRNRSGDNGTTTLERYFYDLNSGEVTLINRPGASVNEGIAQLSTNGRILGTGSKPWMISNGATILLEGLQVTSTTGAAAQKFSQLGWTIDSLNDIDPKGRMTVTVHTSTGARQIVILSPVLDENGNGIADDYETEMRHAFDSDFSSVVLDPDVDYDGDGLTLAQEQARGTSDGDASSRPTTGQSNSDRDRDGVPDAEDPDPDDPVINWHKPEYNANFAVVSTLNLTGDQQSTASIVGVPGGIYYGGPQAYGPDVVLLAVSPSGRLLLGTRPNDPSSLLYNYKNYSSNGSPIEIGSPGEGSPFHTGILSKNYLGRIDGQNRLLGVAYCDAPGDSHDTGYYLTRWSEVDGFHSDDSGSVGEGYLTSGAFNSSNYLAHIGPGRKLMYDGVGSYVSNDDFPSGYRVMQLSEGGIITLDHSDGDKAVIYDFRKIPPRREIAPPPYKQGSISPKGVAELIISHGDEQYSEKRDLVLTNMGLWVAQAGGGFSLSGKGATAAFVSKQGWLLYRESTGANSTQIPPMLWADGEMHDLSDLINKDSLLNGDDIVKVQKVLNMTEGGLITAVAKYTTSSGVVSTRIINLVPVDVNTTKGSQESSPAADVAAPDDFRKISLSGIPKSEAKPQSDSESDLQGESTYVDSYTRFLRHDTSHVYQPVPSSDLALQATMSWEGSPIQVNTAALPTQTMNSWDPNRVGAQAALTRSIEQKLSKEVGLFGAAWTTNLGASAHIAYTFRRLTYAQQINSNDSNTLLNSVGVDSISVTVPDESGRSLKFIVLGTNQFRQTSSLFPRKADLGTTLTRENGPLGDSLVLRKKFGVICTYPLPSDTPALKIGNVATNTSKDFYANLASVVDRYGNGLTLTVPATSGTGTVEVVGKSSLNFKYHVSSSSKYSGHQPFRLIDSITDPLQKVTRFEYDWVDITGAKIPVISRVIKPDGSVQKYSYSTRVGSLHSGDDRNAVIQVGNPYVPGAKQKKLDISKIQQISPRLQSLFFHINLVGITNPAGATWSIEYEGSPRHDLVSINPSVTARIPHTSGGANIGSSPSSTGPSEINVGNLDAGKEIIPHNILEKIQDTVKNDILASAEVEYAKSHGSELKVENPVTHALDQHTGIFALPASEGPDVVKLVILPDGSTSTISSKSEGDRPLPANPYANDAGSPASNIKVDPSFPVFGVSRDPGYTIVRDALGNVTDYVITGPIFFSPQVPGVNSPMKLSNDESRLAFKLLGYKQLQIRSYGRGTVPRTAYYNFQPSASFALIGTQDHQNNFITYLHSNESDDLASAPGGRYGADSGWNSVILTGATQATLTAAGSRFPEPSAEVHGFAQEGQATILPQKTFKYDADSRKMVSSVDRNGNETVDTIENGLRTSEKIYQGLAASNSLLSEQSFIYGENGAPASFMTRSVVKKIAASENAGTQNPALNDWVQDLVTTYTPDSLGHVATQTTYPSGLGGAALTTQYSYDFAGHKISETDPKGKTTNFAYDDVGHLIQVTYPQVDIAGVNGSVSPGRPVKTFQYDAAGRKICETDERGYSTLWNYDIMGRVIATGRDMNASGALDSGDIVTRTEYNAVGLPVKVTDPNGSVTLTAYDDLLRPVSITDPMGGITRMAYDDAGANSGSGLANGPGYKPTRIRNPRGYLTIRKYDDYYRVKSEQVEFLLPANLPEGESGDGWKTRALDNAHATLTETTYDPNGNPTVTKSYRTATNVLETATSYDGLNRAVSVTTGVGQGSLASTSSTAYSSTGLKKETVAYSGITTLERRTRSEYDGAGRLTKVWSPNPVDGSVTRDPAVNGLTTTAYDANGNVAATTSYRGTTTTTAANGAITTAASTSATTTTEYDARNRPVNIYSSAASVYSPDSGGSFSDGEAHVRKAYDAVGNAITVTDPRGQVTLTAYDVNNRATDVTAANGTTIAATTSTAYDKNGNIIAVTDPNSSVTRNQYDRLNRLVATAVNPTTGKPSANLNTPTIGDVTVRNTYDAAGNLVSVLDGEGVYWGPNTAHTTDFSYDGLNRKIAQTWDKGTQSWGSYTPKGTLHWTYDALVMTQSANARGETTSYEYDGLLRPVTLTYSNAGTTPPCRLYYQGASTATPAAGYASGPGPLLASLHPSSGSSLYQDTLTTYDRLDRVLSETSAGETHSYSYDVAGNRVLTAYAKTGRKLVTQYDKLGRVTRIVDTAGAITDPSGYTPGGTDLVTSYAYDAGGLVLRKNQANHTATLNTYDLRGRLSTTRTRYYPPGGGGTNADLSAFDYSQPQSGDTAHTSGYDNLGNVIHVVETYSGLPARDVLNSYDRTNRLVTEQDTDSGHTTLTSYTYTENNSRYDRTVRVDSGPYHTTRFRYGNPNIGYNSDQLYGVGKLDANPQPGDDSNFKYRYTYDADGNRATRVTDPGTAAEKVDTYTYDQRNRLIGVTTTQTSSGAIVARNGYAYDERTRRTSTNEGYPATFNRRLSFSGGSYVQEYGPNPTTLPTLQLVRGSDMGGGVGGILYNDGVSGVTFNNYNSRGDVVSQTNNGGASTWAGKYDAFGTHTDSSTNSAVGRQRANSKDEDPTGLLNEGMRYRDLEAGLFLTRDPAGLVDGPNVYTYVNQNPWTHWDPLGLESDKDGVRINRDGHHISPVESWADNDDLSPDVRRGLDSHRVKPPAGADAPPHGNSKAHIKYTERVKIIQEEFIAESVKNGVNPSKLSGKAAKEFADDMVNAVMKDEYVAKFNSVVALGEGSTKNLNLLLKDFNEAKGVAGWSKSYKTASNWIGMGSKKLPILGAIITTAGIAIGVANADTSEKANEAIMKGIYDSTLAGFVADASGMRVIEESFDTGKKFRDDPDFFYNEDPKSLGGGTMGWHMNEIKRLGAE